MAKNKFDIKTIIDPKTADDFGIVQCITEAHNEKWIDLYYWDDKTLIIPGSFYTRVYIDYGKCGFFGFNIKHGTKPRMHQVKHAVSRVIPPGAERNAIFHLIKSRNNI